MADNKDILTAEDVKELQPLYAAVISALKEVYDPEIPVNIYDLGLIYELTISKAREVSILMTFTAPNCPMADQVIAEVQEGVESVPGVTKCTIDLTFEPVLPKKRHQYLHACKIFCTFAASKVKRNDHYGSV